MTVQIRRYRNYFLRLLILILVTFGFWSSGLIWFVSEIPTESQSDLSRTDAIVVLTGGAERLNEGLKLMDRNKLARRLFISGVARGVDIKTLLKVARHKPNDLNCCISIGYQADNTAGNAKETAKWMQANQFGSYRLITANYHMPRSLREFKAVLPDFNLIPHPVFPSVFKSDSWKTDFFALQIVVTEYNKFLFSQLAKSIS